MGDNDLASKAGTVKIGDVNVNRLGLGTNRITDTPQSYELLKCAVDLGVNFIDTAHRYGSGASETGIGNGLAPYADGVLIATKGGFDYPGPEGSEAVLRQELDESLRRLKLEHIDLYQLHRVDPKVPIEESVAALKKFQDEGKIRHIGLSEVSVEQLEAARQVADIVSVQNEYNVLVRHHEALVDYCTEHGIVFIPWFPLGGLNGGAEEVEDRLRAVAEQYDASSQQIALAWLLKRSPIMLPIPGTLSIDHLEANLQAASIALSDKDFQSLL
ncbi:MAG TPA: aldo/keto reductase [Verrucomicrobiae bacterium]|nr:aldo/keto reductase [Verrucomicrobiae bacterium]